MIPVNRPLISEVDVNAVLAAVGTSEISGTSNPVRELEERMQDFLDVKHFVATSNGTSAIDCVTDALNIEESENAVIPALTIISTVSNLIRKKVKIRIVDVDLHTFMPTNDSLLDNVDTNTKLVIPTHIYGLVHDVEELKNALVDTKTLVIEDAAEVFGVQNQSGKYAGTVGLAGTYSFYANKNITGGEGGGIVTNSDTLANRLRELRNLGFSQTGERFIHNIIGWNARLPGMSAALINSQLSRTKEIIGRKKEIGARYLCNLKDHPWLSFQATSHNDVENAFWVFAILTNTYSPYNASQLRQLLESKEIETRRFFYPLHLQPVIQKSGLLETIGKMPNSELLWERGLYLPSGPGTTDQEIDLVSEVLWDFYKEFKNV